MAYKRLLTNSKAILFVGAIATFFLFSLQVSAHLMPRGKGSLNVVGSKAYIVLSLPVSVFVSNEIERQEFGERALKQSEASIRERIRGGLHVISNGNKASFDQVLLSLPSDEGEEHHHQNDDLMVMIVARFESVPNAIFLHSELWSDGAESILIKATVSQGEKTLKQEQDSISMSHPSAIFFSENNEASKSSSLKSPLFFCLALLGAAFMFLFLIVFLRRDSSKSLH